MPEPPDFDKWTGDVHGTPDFRQIARDVYQSDDFDGNPIPEIEEALRQVWNARGAADLKALEARDTVLDFESPIRSLDR